MTKYLQLVYDSHTHHNNDGEDSNEPYSYRGTTSTHHNFKHLVVSNKDTYHAYPLSEDQEVNSGDVLFAVIAVYSTGDTFGRDEGSEVELVSVHKDINTAMKNKNAIEGRNRANGMAHTFTIELDNGANITRYCPWDGYFESLDSCNVYPLQVLEY